MIVVKISGLRVRKDLEFIRTALFLDCCKGIHPNNFTRNRKMPLDHLILSMINRKGLTLTMELKKFFKLINPKMKISKPGYLKQRKKLNPKAFMLLSDFHVRNFYEEESTLKKYKEHFIFAIDGSKINIPTTEENLKIYGGHRNKSLTQQAQIGFSSIYDVFNKMILDCTISQCNLNERLQAEIHINKVKSFINDNPFIVILDRGYPSSQFFINRIEKNQKFVVRLHSKDFKKEQHAMQTDDEELEIIFTKDRIHPYRGTDFADKLREVQSIKLRLVKVVLSSGVTEILATNLDKNEFPTEDIYELYGYRWGIETVYDTLKNKLMLENFTGIKSIIIEQDIYSTVYLSNLTHDLIFDAEKEQQRKDNGKYKYEMIINTNIAIGIIKEDLIHFIIERNDRKKTEMFERIIKEISENIIPVRKKRQFKRHRQHGSSKFSNTNKRSY